jgi:aspartyl-tRNA(Asn)/glutamyl-tRNA(Gln) amidotransferase subunit A
MYWEDLDPEVERVTVEAVRVLESLSDGIAEMQLPVVDNLTIAEAEAFAYHEPWLENSPDLYSAPIRERLFSGGRVTSAAYIRARREMERWRRDIDGIFEDVDLLVTPTLPVLPVRIGAASDLALIRNTNAFDVYGLPTISVPCGFSASGLPIGLQITGRSLDESTVLRMANAYEQAAGWVQHTPPLS